MMTIINHFYIYFGFAMRGIRNNGRHESIMMARASSLMISWLSTRFCCSTSSISVKNLMLVICIALALICMATAASNSTGVMVCTPDDTWLRLDVPVCICHTSTPACEKSLEKLTTRAYHSPRVILFCRLKKYCSALMVSLIWLGDGETPIMRSIAKPIPESFMAYMRFLVGSDDLVFLSGLNQHVYDRLSHFCMYEFALYMTAGTGPNEVKSLFMSYR